MSTEKEHKGGVVVLPVPENVAQELSLEDYGFEKADNLHITLAYVFYRNFDKDVWFDLVCGNLLKVGFPPANGYLGKLVNFNLKEKEESKDFALVVKVNMSKIYDWREQFARSVKSDGLSISNLFNPHMTLAYYDDKSELENIDVQSKVSQFTGQSIYFGPPEIWLDNGKYSFKNNSWTYE